MIITPPHTLICSVYEAKQVGPTCLKVSIYVPDQSEKDLAYHKRCLDPAIVPAKVSYAPFKSGRLIWHQIGSLFQEDRNSSDGKISTMNLGGIMEVTIPLQMVNLCMVPADMIRWGAGLNPEIALHKELLEYWEKLGHSAKQIWSRERGELGPLFMLYLLVKPAVVAQIASQDL